MKNLVVEWGDFDNELTDGNTEQEGWRGFSTEKTGFFFSSYVEDDNRQLMIDWLIKNELSLYESICEFFNANYQELLANSKMLDGFIDQPSYEHHHLGHFTKEQMLAGDIFSLVDLSTIVLQRFSDGDVYFGFLFECAWDEDNGIAILVKNDKVVGSGEGTMVYDDMS